MRIDLARQRLQARLHQQSVLLFELNLVSCVVPDLDRQCYREVSRSIDRGDAPPLQVIAQRYKGEDPERFMKQQRPNLAQKFGQKNAANQQRMEDRTREVPPFPQALNQVQVKQR